MLKIVIDDIDAIFCSGMEAYLRDYFSYQQGMPVEFNRLSIESISEADIIIKGFEAGQTSFCPPLLKHRKKGSLFFGVYGDFHRPQHSNLPLCIKDIVYINRRDPVDKIRDIIAKRYHSAKEEFSLRHCGNCKCVTLTRKQAAIISMLVIGASIDNIALALDVSEKTVYAHKANLMKRLGIRSTCQLLRLINTLGQERD